MRMSETFSFFTSYKSKCARGVGLIWKLGTALKRFVCKGDVDNIATAGS